MQPCAVAARFAAPAVRRRRRLALDCGGGGGGGGNGPTTGAGAATAVARGSASVSVCPPFCSVAALRSTDCKIQPLWPSPVRSRTSIPRRRVDEHGDGLASRRRRCRPASSFGRRGTAGGGGGGGRGAATGTLAIAWAAVATA